MNRDGFFIGWEGRAAPGQGVFLALAGFSVAAGLTLSGWLLGRGIDDPAAGLVGLSAGPVVAPRVPVPRDLTGVFTAEPYPILHLAPTPDHPQGEAILLTGWGKTGIPVPPEFLGRPVRISGTEVSRGDIAMLVTGGEIALSEVTLPPPPEPVSLGRWRITGEICDGKCYAGVMAPGTGLSHKACAALCFLGEVPLVFVAAAPAGGSAYFILAGPDGRRAPDSARALIGVPVRLEGDLIRLGSALVFRADFSRAELP